MATVDLNSIDYMDEPDLTYRKGLDKARVPEELRDLLERFAALFPDAYEQGKGMSDEDFMQFRAGLRKERKGIFAGIDFMNNFGAILMPANMMHIGLVADKYGVPFGVAFCRMKDAGVLSVKDGVCKILEKPVTK